MRRLPAAISALLFVVLAVALAEAALVGLLLLLSYVLGIQLAVELGSGGLLFAPGLREGQVVSLFNPTAVVSILFSSACGFGAAAWTFRRWRRAA